MARWAQAEDGSALCRLPLDHALVAQALGSEVRWLADTGDLVATPCCEGVTGLEHLAPIDLGAGRVAETLTACADLARQGAAVQFSLPGPLSLAADLLGAERLLKAIRRDPQGTWRALGRLCGQTERLACAAVCSGAALICLADPLCARELLGPRSMRQLADNVLCSHVRGLLVALNGRAVLAVCPRVCSGLEGAEGMACPRRLGAVAGRSRAQAMLAYAGRAAAVGGPCLEGADLDLPDDGLWVFELR